MTVDDNVEIYSNKISSKLKNTKANILSLNNYAKNQFNTFDLFNFLTHSEEVENEEFSICKDNEIRKNEKILFDEHISIEEMQRGIKTGAYFRGKINFVENKYDSAIVKAYLFDKDILISSIENINRAVHGDVVCIQILDEKGKTN